MIMWNVTPDDLTAAVREANLSYDGNIKWRSDFVARGRALSSSLTVKSSRDLGARRSSSGRRLAAACWHAYRDVLVELFERCPDARVKTMVADYRGKDSFEAEFPATAETNMGSAFEPLCYADACDCES